MQNILVFPRLQYGSKCIYLIGISNYSKDETNSKVINENNKNNNVNHSVFSNFGRF